MKAVIWGAGGTATDFLRKKIMYCKYEIVCFTDNNPTCWGTYFFQNMEIIAPTDLYKYDYDMIIICSLYYEDIRKQLMKEMHISEEKIITYKDIERAICDSIIEKYENVADEDMAETLEVFKKGDVSILGSYNPPVTAFSEVLRDDDGFPYILFEKKRMYYPEEYKFKKIDGKDVVEDILYEQGKGSPHLYIPEGYKMPEDAVIADAGVCEGNFALRYVEAAKKVYLIEADKLWMKALKMTFKPYKEKVIFCEKRLSGRDNSREITLDKLVTDELTFLKMDIEGAEVDALLGGKEVLTQNNVQCAVCSYHRQYDEAYISHILKSYGYKTRPSKGYMFFAFDDQMVDTMDLRRGVIYGSK